MAKRYGERTALTISDDFIFGKTTGDRCSCHDVLERMLGKRGRTAGMISSHRGNSVCRGMVKPVRLDMYAGTLEILTGELYRRRYR
ncbi:MAG: hypothetical protein ACLTAX_15420 [Waltera sp.]